VKALFLIVASSLVFCSCNNAQKTSFSMERYMMAKKNDSLKQDSLNRALATTRTFPHGKFSSDATGWINALISYHNTFIAGGYFTDADNSAGHVKASNIAEWNGISWSELGNGGLSSEVYSLTEFRDSLYACTKDGLFKLNKANWQHIGFDNGRFDIPFYSYNNELYGEKTIMEDDPDRIATQRSVGVITKWNGFSWNDVAKLYNDSPDLGYRIGYVSSYVTYKGELYITGVFNKFIETDGSTIDSSSVIKCNGNKWIDISGDLPKYNIDLPECLKEGFIVYKDSLYLNYYGLIYKYNAGKWVQFPYISIMTGIGIQNYFTRQLYEGNNGDLYAIGVPPNGTSDQQCIFKWNGTKWEATYICYVGTCMKYSGKLFEGGSSMMRTGFVGYIEK